MSERVYRLGRCPWPKKGVGVGSWSEPGSWIAKFSAEQWGAATVDEVANGDHGVCALPMGMEREDRCE